MASNSSPSYTGGIGIGGALTIVFVVLKLTHVIDWSWWWVLSPVWIPFALAAVILLVVGLAKLVFGREPKRRTHRY